MKKIYSLFLISLFIFALSACDFSGGGSNPNENDPKPTITDSIDGIYELQKKVVSGADITSAFSANLLLLNEGNVTWYEAEADGVKTQSGTYYFANTTLTIVIGVKQYIFSVNKSEATLSLSQKVNKRQTEMVYKLSKRSSLPISGSGVDFESELFGDNIDENFYNYCPTALVEGNTMHIWYCSNKDSGNVTDYIAYRKGILGEDGKWTFSEKQLVLSPTASAWDCVHTCDPSVVKGEFYLNGQKYPYMMSYLGCKTYDCSYNEVGLAFAKSPEGPWIKYEGNPICNFYNSQVYAAYPGSWQWGYGQPSLLNMEGDGKVLLIYTAGEKTRTYIIAERWDFSDIANPQLLSKAEVGKVGINTGFNNADFIYDDVNKKVYIVKDDSPYPTDGNVDWLSGSVSVYEMSLSSNEEFIGQTLFGNNFTWALVKTINKASTGYARNHNAGFLTDCYGHVINPYKIDVLYTISKLKTDYPTWSLNGQWPALHTYRIHGFCIEV